MAATPSTSQPVAPTRSHLIHRAAEHYPSRFALVRATARCARLFHNPGQRIGESINQALERIADPALSTQQFPCMSCPTCVDDGTPSDCPFKGPTEAHVAEVAI